MHNSKPHIIITLICIISFMMHFNHFHKDFIGVHVWRQTQTQSTTMSFVNEDLNILEPKRNARGNSDGIFQMEFPLMQWTNALLIKATNEEIKTTRFFMFLIGCLSIFGIYNLILILFNSPITAIVGSMAFTFSPSIYYYHINPLPDNLALCFSIWGILYILKYIKESESMGTSLIGTFFLSLSALCKLPFILFFAFPLIYLLRSTSLKKFLVLKNILVLSPIILPLSWYAWVIPKWPKNPVINGILEPESLSKLIDNIQHNLISTLPELLLNYANVLFFVFGLFQILKSKNLVKNPINFAFLISSLLVIAYYLFEANPIGKVHDYYLFPFMPILVIIISFGFLKLKSRSGLLKILSYSLVILLPLTCYLRMGHRWNTDKPGFNKDFLIYKKELRNISGKSELVIVGNDASGFINLYYLDKYGWYFEDDRMDQSRLKQLINKGAKYLIYDSNKINIEELKPLFKSEPKIFGSIKVYELNS